MIQKSFVIFIKILGHATEDYKSLKKEKGKGQIPRREEECAPRKEGTSPVGMGGESEAT